MAQPSAYPVPREHLRDYLTDADRRRIRKGSLMPFSPAELKRIQKEVNGVELKGSYAKTRTGVPKKPFRCGDNMAPDSLRSRILNIAPRIRGDAKPAAWFAKQLNTPAANVGAALSDLSGKNAVSRRPAAKRDLEDAGLKGRTRQWAYWKP
jgi:hypothetical protein